VRVGKRRLGSSHHLKNQMAFDMRCQNVMGILRSAALAAMENVFY
jgi:hypothetical protein